MLALQRPILRRMPTKIARFTQQGKWIGLDWGAVVEDDLVASLSDVSFAGGTRQSFRLSS